MTLRRRREADEREHREFIASLRCVACGDNTSVEPAHLRTANLFWGKCESGLGRKPTNWLLPLCSECHREQHDVGEMPFWDALGIDPFILSMALKNCSGDCNMAEKVFDAHGIPPAH